MPGSRGNQNPSCTSRSKLAMVAAILLAAMFSASDVNGSDEVFDPASIGEVWLEIPDLSWTPIDDAALSGCRRHMRKYHAGVMRIGEERFTGAGVRVKGGCGSSRMLDGKAGFKVHLSWDDPDVPGCPETRTYKDLKRFTFNNQVEDASFTHERIGYHFLRDLGVPVPRVAPVRLYVNDQLWGLYLNVETIDRRFLAPRFGSQDGMLYEADYGCDLGEENCFEPKFDTDECDTPREGDPTDMTPLRALNARLTQLPDNDFYPAIEQFFDFDTFLTTWAAAAVMGYVDGYPNDPNNYRLYHDPSDDRWTLIPTGTDQLFQNDVNPFDPVGRLAKRCLSEPDCKAAFRTRMSEVIDRFEAGDYTDMARAIERQISNDVTADPRKEITVSEWHAAVRDTIAYIQRRPGELRAQLADSERKQPVKDLFLRVFTSDDGDRNLFVSWLVRDELPTKERWLTARGIMRGLTSEFVVTENVGGRFDGEAVGKVTVSFVDCQTARVDYEPDDPAQEPEARTTEVDSSIWKYCN